MLKTMQKKILLCLLVMGVSGAALATESVTVEHIGAEIIPIGMDGLLVPIEITPPRIQITGQHGMMMISADSSQSTIATTIDRLTVSFPLFRESRSPIGIIQDPITPPRNLLRPTLFVTIGGAKSGNSDGRGLDDWQGTFENRIISAQDPGVEDYQRVVWTVNWDSIKPNITQVDTLTTLINNHLNSRVDAWDVVLVGFSRGGIFAHEVSKDIIKNSNLHSLYTVLLDPTAATNWIDRYPSELATSANDNSFGFLYCDNHYFLKVKGSTYEGPTQGDEPITGYDNSLCNDSNDLGSSSHVNVPVDFLNHELIKILNTLHTKKSSEGVDDFVQDGINGSKEQRISTGSSPIDYEISKNEFYLATNGLLSNTIYLLAEEGNLTAEVSFDSLHSFQNSVGKDGVLHQVNTPLGSAGFTHTEDEITINDNFAGIGTTTTIQYDNVHVKIQIFGTEVDLSLKDGYNNGNELIILIGDTIKDDINDIKDNPIKIFCKPFC